MKTKQRNASTATEVVDKQTLANDCQRRVDPGKTSPPPQDRQRWLGTWAGKRACVHDATTISGMMVTPGRTSLAGVYYRIWMPIQAGKTHKRGVGGLGAANDIPGIMSMTPAASASVTAAEQLEGNVIAMRLRSEGPKVSRAPSDMRRCMEWTTRQQAQE